ncbi:hypothetical protein C8N24_6412 [Solirubrobacter pauli]|uniref:Subtilisin inhibitor-like n=1 Tax=Solirubrobacter pauli TaxID=166793 RepID=A0A660KUX3_9ACTN|nr:hypothetical protein [Solirubrobacter pauli]RKQ84783.1 hypothetical protein C8N24_6412 [Solirubrobacter pauli]
MKRWLTALVLTIGVLAATPGAAVAAGPSYDVPQGFTRCPHAVAWHGFFKWASARHTTCAAASRFMRSYAARAHGTTMPRHVAGYACRIHYWRDAEDNVYASRHVCTRDDVAIRFYGMV